MNVRKASREAAITAAKVRDAIRWRRLYAAAHRNVATNNSVASLSVDTGRPPLRRLVTSDEVEAIRN